MKFNVDYTLFGALKYGETFYYEPSGLVWMKLYDGDNVYNSAVSLDDGTICTFDNTDHVIKVDIKCEITIHFDDKHLDN